jgi:hypothetical protein
MWVRRAGPGPARLGRVADSDHRELDRLPHAPRRGLQPVDERLQVRQLPLPQVVLVPAPPLPPRRGSGHLRQPPPQRPVFVEGPLPVGLGFGAVLHPPLQALGAGVWLPQQREDSWRVHLHRRSWARERI